MPSVGPSLSLLGEAGTGASAPSSEPSAEDSKKIGRVESIKQFLLHGGGSGQNGGSGPAHHHSANKDSSEQPQCNCRHHPTAPPHHPPFLPAFAAPPPPHPLVHRRSKSSERLNTRMSLATPPTSMITPTTAALIGPFIFYQPHEISR